MLAGVHADGIARTRLDAVPTKDAAKLVDHEADRIAFVPVTLVPLGILAGVDVDALRGARGRATQAGHAPHAPVGTGRQTVNSPETVGIRPFLLRIRDGRDAFVVTVENGVGTAAPHHVAGVVEE